MSPRPNTSRFPTAPFNAKLGDLVAIQGSHLGNRIMEHIHSHFVLRRNLIYGYHACLHMLASTQAGV
eukprot:15017471-Heterocapsa_arctica.AAC.1